LEYFKIETPDHLQIQAYSWPADNPLALLQIAHGMQEHARRYDHFAKWMNSHRIAVYANDHIGHGLTAENLSDLGHFPGKDDWQRSVDILQIVNKKIRADHPGLPLFLLGQSMGSVLVQTCMMRYGGMADGYILCGAIRQPLMIAWPGKIVSSFLSGLQGPAARSRLLISMGYGRYNKYFRPNRTPIDWLCGNEDIVDEYIDSPLCGMPLTNRFYRNLADGFLYIIRKSHQQRIPAGTPVLIVAGSRDPAGFFGKAPRKISDQLKEIARANVSLKIYPGARHEVLNETNREEVYGDLLEWMRKRISQQSAVGGLQI
jgi:alpha-beta hydrolase superfamily lysophospholipase